MIKIQPIFKEQIRMWSDLGFDIPITEGFYWLDRGIIKAFSPDGILHKLFKYKVNDDLTINITKHKEHCDFSPESWEETCERLKYSLQNKIDESLNVIKSTLNTYSDYDFWCLTSTGKDSTVVLDLVRKVIPNIKVMFNNTTCDAADTYRIVKKHPDWVITTPKEGIYNYFNRLNFIPTRFSRACCSTYKEGQSIQYFKAHGIDKLIQIMGVRNDKSNKRADREYVAHNPKWNDKDWYGLLPIRKWIELDVWLYILHNQLEINNKYRKGYSRVGCSICCPYYTKSTWVLDKYWYPLAYERWHKILQEDFLQNSRWQQLNCTVKEYHSCWNGGLVRPEPTKEIIDELMKHKNISDYEIAKQYFNKTCCGCGKNIRQDNVLAMNMKYLGRNTTEFFCKKCFKQKFDLSEEKWNKQINGFKAQGC